MSIHGVLKNVCRYITIQGNDALDAQPVERCRTVPGSPQVLSIKSAELHNMNDMVTRVLERSTPVFRVLGIRVVLRLDTLLPLVQVLVQPTEEALAAALDLVLKESPDAVLVDTQVVNKKAIATIEGRILSTEAMGLAAVGGYEPGPESAWLETGHMGRVEFLVAERTTRALGGVLRIQRRDSDFRVRIELPIITQPNGSWVTGALGAQAEARGALPFGPVPHLINEFTPKS